MRSIRLGDVKISRLEELMRHGGVPATFFPEYDAEEWERHEHLLEPPEWLPDQKVLGMCMQSWVVESDGRTMIIDTGVGNDKERMGPLDHLHTPYLELLAAAGIRPEDVDVVLHTHLHMDHVGWNTRLVDGDWVPTFPNATYVLPVADLDFWDPENDDRYDRRGTTMMSGVYADSITPVLRNARVETWQDEYVIDGNLRIEAAPGHTPGNAVIKVSSRGDEGVFVGDMMHSSAQIALPHWNSCFCESPTESRTSRMKTLGWAADHGALIFAGHFGQDRAAEVARDASAFKVKAWKGFDEGDHGPGE
jgi:glyoxylase-like metal-dependent hydrolase (beta-lactamase superfamily II)